MGHGTTGDILERDLSVDVVDVHFPIHTAHHDVAAVHGSQRERGVHRDGQGQVYGAAHGRCADVYLVVLGLHVQPGAVQGNAMESARMSTRPLVVVFFVVTTRFGFHDHVLAVVGLHCDTAAQQMGV